MPEVRLRGGLGGGTAWPRSRRRQFLGELEDGVLSAWAAGRAGGCIDQAGLGQGDGGCQADGTDHDRLIEKANHVNRPLRL
jgi:hypothetical protein